MSRFNANGRPGWFAAGVALAVLLVPVTVAASTVLVVSGTMRIEGQSTSPSSVNHVQVSQAGQMLTTPATPHEYYLRETGFSADWLHVIAAPPRGRALIVTSLHLDANPAAASGPEEFRAWISSGKGGCSGPQLLSVDRVLSAVDGETVLPYEPGVAIPSGDVLCGEMDKGLGSGDTTAVGYSVPASSVQGPG